MMTNVTTTCVERAIILYHAHWHTRQCAFKTHCIWALWCHISVHNFYTADGHKWTIWVFL